MRTGTAASAAANNRILLLGEEGYTTDTHVFKVGDGVTHWNDLASVSGTTLTQEQVEDYVGAMVTGNTETGITATYDDTAGKLNFVTSVTTAYTDEQAQDAVGGMFTGNVETRVAATYDDAGNKIDVAVDEFPIMIPFSLDGTLTVVAGTKQIYNPSGRTITIKRVQVQVVTAPTGAAILVDVNINGTTIFTTQGNRPSIAASATVSSIASAAGQPDSGARTWSSGQYVTVDIDQIGSTIAGANLTGIIYAEI